MANTNLQDAPSSLTAPLPISQLDLEAVVQANDKLASSIQHLYEEVIKVARAKYDHYNNLAALAAPASKRIREINKENIHLKKFIPPAEKFPLEVYYLDNATKIITELQADVLLRNIESTLNEIKACEAIISNTSPNKEQSEFDVLCHKYNSFTSPLIWVIHDDKLSESQKLVLIAALADQTPLNSKVCNMDIACGEPEYPNIFSKKTPLTHAVKYGSLEMVKLLVKKTTNIDALPCPDKRCVSTDESKTALHFAVERGDPAIVELLLQHGANVNALDKNGDTPLHKVEDLKCAEILLNHAANPNLKNAEGQAPLHLICGKKIISYADFSKTKHLKVCEENLALISLLNKQGADINAQDNSDCTPLYYAVNTGSDSNIDYAHIKNIISLLCEQSANVNLASKSGITPLLKLYDRSNVGFHERE